MRQVTYWFKWRWAILILILLIVGSAVGLALDIYSYSLVSDPESADAAILLGAAIWSNRPSPVFRERINHAIELYHSRQIRFIIFTGGQGLGESAAEAVIGSKYAVAQGIAKSDVFCETHSKTTYENLSGAKAIAEQQHFGRVLIVSDPLHMRRALTIAHDLGINAYPSPTPTTRYVSLSSQLLFLLGEVRVYATYLAQRSSLDGTADEDAVASCE